MFISRKKYKELLKMCYYDKATGAYNRNWFEKNYIENPVHKNISLAVIDINNLKRVNDSNGHFAGDELIKKVNDKLSQYATVVRWGGDEFFCIIDAEKEQEFENFCKSQKEFAYAYKFNFDKVDIGNVAEQLDELMYKCKRIQKSENENK